MYPKPLKIEVSSFLGRMGGHNTRNKHQQWAAVFSRLEWIIVICMLYNGGGIEPHSRGPTRSLDVIIKVSFLD